MNDNPDLLRQVDELERAIREIKPPSTTVLMPKARSIDVDGH